MRRSPAFETTVKCALFTSIHWSAAAAGAAGHARQQDENSEASPLDNPRPHSPHRRLHPAHLLIHRQEIKGIPSFDERPFAHASDGRAPEIDRPPRRLAAEPVADMTADNVAVRGDAIPLGYRLHDLDLEFSERSNIARWSGSQALRPVLRGAGQAVDLRIGRHEAIDRFLAPFVPHLLELFPHDGIRRSTHAFLDLHVSNTRRAALVDCQAQRRAPCRAPWRQLHASGVLADRRNGKTGDLGDGEVWPITGAEEQGNSARPASALSRSSRRIHA